MFEESLELKQNFHGLLYLMLDSSEEETLFKYFIKNDNYLQVLLDIIVSPESSQKIIQNAIRITRRTRIPRNRTVTLSKQQKLHLTDMLFNHNFYNSMFGISDLYFILFKKPNELSDFCEMVIKRLDSNEAKSAVYFTECNFYSSQKAFFVSVIVTDEPRRNAYENITDVKFKPPQVIKIRDKLEN